MGDLPTLLVENYTHWLNLSNGEIEARPIADLWQSSNNLRVKIGGYISHQARILECGRDRQQL
jgi:hypothetical protein